MQKAAALAHLQANLTVLGRRRQGTVGAASCGTWTNATSHLAG